MFLSASFRDDEDRGRSVNNHLRPFSYSVVIRSFVDPVCRSLIRTIDFQSAHVGVHTCREGLSAAAHSAGKRKKRGLFTSPTNAHDASDTFEMIEDCKSSEFSESRLDHVLQLSALLHLLDDVEAADKLALDDQLRERRPLVHFLQLCVRINRSQLAKKSVACLLLLL